VGEQLPGLILPGVTSAYGIFMIRQYLQGLPKDYEEAAPRMVPSELQIFWQIVVRCSHPAIATLAPFSSSTTGTTSSYPLS